MPGITAEGSGFSFILDVLETYWGEALPLFLLFLAALPALILLRKKDGSRMFVCIFFCLLLTIYNPVLSRYASRYLHLDTVYYRLLWLLPAAAVLAYAAVRLSCAASPAFFRVPAVLLLSILLVLAGQPLAAVWQPSVPDNLYKVPDDLVEACAIIHEDSAEEQPTVVFDTNLNMVARQYDPSLLLALNRNAVLYRAGSQTVSAVNTESASYKAQEALMDVAYYGQEIPMRRFKAAIRWRQVDYLVVPQNNPLHDYIEEAGCTPAGSTRLYVVYRCRES